MTITKAQRWKILELWSAVCKNRGWRAGDRAFRLETFGGILGRGLKSTDQIGRLDECTKVMAELEAMLGVSLRAGMEAADPGRNRKRNWRWLIEKELLPCLALYVENGLPGARAYLVEVMVGKSRWRKADRPESVPSLADFGERTCQQIFWTVSARLNSHRKASGDTGHDMKTKAGVRCDCATICRRKMAVEVGSPIPPLPVGTDDAETTAEILHETEGENPF